MRLTFFLCAALTLCTTVASAQEIIEIDRTPRGEPLRRLNPEQTRAEAAGAWAQEVLDRAAGVPAAGAEPERRARCDADPDRAAHGEVWGEVGTAAAVALDASSFMVTLALAPSWAIWAEMIAWRTEPSA